MTPRRRVLITGGIKRYVGREAVILTCEEGGSSHEERDGTIRVAFENFWTRPDGLSSEEADDSTWLFKGEYTFLKGE